MAKHKRDRRKPVAGSRQPHKPQPPQPPSSSISSYVAIAGAIIAVLVAVGALLYNQQPSQASGGDGGIDLEGLGWREVTRPTKLMMLASRGQQDAFLATLGQTGSGTEVKVRDFTICATPPQASTPSPSLCAVTVPRRVCGSRPLAHNPRDIDQVAS